MNLKKMTLCSKKLNFSPLEHSAAELPAWAWKNYLLKGFQSTQDLCLVLEGPFTEICQALHPRLSLPELARLQHKLVAENLDIDSATLFSRYGHRWDQRLAHLTPVIAQLPLEFAHWCSQKDLGLKDFSVLAAAPAPMIEKVAVDIARRQPSRSLGVQMLEWALELLLTGHSDVFHSSLDNAKWHKWLRDQRFPRATRQDRHMQSKTNQLAWPLHTTAKWQRHGDQSGVQLQTTLCSQRDFERHLHGLQRVYQDLQERPEKLWTN